MGTREFAERWKGIVLAINTADPRDASEFQLLLIGKDGHVALRSSQPVAAAALQHAIDAMPMRQAGER